MTTVNLATAAAELGVTLSASDVVKFTRLLDELDEWNTRFNLTAIRERAAQLTKHLLDSLSIHSYLRGTRILDVGTGAGFPGLPLALANPERAFTLLDSTAKKLKFVEHAAEVTELKNVVTVHSRAEQYRVDDRFSTVISRAVGNVESFVRTSGHLCAGGGRLLAMKGRDPRAELENLPNGWKIAAVTRLRVPGLDEERHLVEICRSHDRVEA
jgi:16S rRNA (guanine527-N7)-methyltransferase